MAGEIDKVAAELAAHADADLKSIGRSLADANARSSARSTGSCPRTARTRARRTPRRCRISSSGARWPAAGSSAAAALAAAKHLAAGTGDARFLHAKIVTARFYADAILPQASSLAVTIAQAGDSTLALAAEQF